MERLAELRKAEEQKRKEYEVLSQSALQIIVINIV